MSNEQVMDQNASDVHGAVQSLYAEAATTPQPGLCCPQDYGQEWRQHIPADAFKFNYGCGSPVLDAGIRPGDRVVDLGSGVGIDCFVAARLVGKTGKVIGIDMTDAMLEKARGFSKTVAANLGYDVVEFVRGHIENIPLPDGSADVVISNCVLNLSPDKARTFREIFRILAPGGRIVAADVVSDTEVPEAFRRNLTQWSECYTGALSASQFMRALHDAGFVGTTMVSEKPWTDVDGVRYASITVQAYKFHKSATCHYEGKAAIYLGPYSMVMDEEGHQFSRFTPVEICADTVARLSSGPYAGSFVIIDNHQPQARTQAAKPTASAQPSSCCDGGGCC